MKCKFYISSCTNTSFNFEKKYEPSSVNFLLTKTNKDLQTFLFSTTLQVSGIYLECYQVWKQKNKNILYFVLLKSRLRFLFQFSKKHHYCDIKSQTNKCTHIFYTKEHFFASIATTKSLKWKRVTFFFLSLFNKVVDTIKVRSMPRIFKEERHWKKTSHEFKTKQAEIRTFRFFNSYWIELKKSSEDDNLLERFWCSHKCFLI